MAPISMDNPLVKTYIVYVGILCVKMLFLSIWTALQRFKRGVFANPEDILVKTARVKYDDRNVERVRRAHLNDLENIPVFIVLGFLYILTNPSVWLATTLFRLSAAARILHTLVYAVMVIPQPARLLAFAVPYSISWYMGFKVITHFISALNRIEVIVGNMAAISLDNPLVQTYIVYAAILSLKLLFLSVWTAVQKHKRGFMKHRDPKVNTAIIDDIERVRRAHRNDIENIPVFFVLGFLYIMTNPSVWLATMLFRLYAAARVVHTLVYAVVVLPQPARVTSWTIPYFISWYMGIKVIIHFIEAV